MWSNIYRPTIGPNPQFSIFISIWNFRTGPHTNRTFVSFFNSELQLSFFWVLGSSRPFFPSLPNPFPNFLEFNLWQIRPPNFLWENFGREREKRNKNVRIRSSDIQHPWRLFGGHRSRTPRGAPHGRGLQQPLPVWEPRRHQDAPLCHRVRALPPKWCYSLPDRSPELQFSFPFISFSLMSFFQLRKLSIIGMGILDLSPSWYIDFDMLWSNSVGFLVRLICFRNFWRKNECSWNWLPLAL